MVGDNNAGDGLDDDDTLLALRIVSTSLQESVLLGVWVKSYLLAVQTTVVGADGEELVTSDSETGGLDGARVAEASGQSADLLGRDLNSLISVRSSGNGRDETERMAYRETGGTSLNAGAVVAKDGGLVKLTGAHQAVKVACQNGVLYHGCGRR